MSSMEKKIEKENVIKYIKVFIRKFFSSYLF